MEVVKVAIPNLEHWDHLTIQLWSEATMLLLRKTRNTSKVYAGWSQATIEKIRNEPSPSCSTAGGFCVVSVRLYPVVHLTSIQVVLSLQSFNDGHNRKQMRRVDAHGLSSLQWLAK